MTPWQLYTFKIRLRSVKFPKGNTCTGYMQHECNCSATERYIFFPLQRSYSRRECCCYLTAVFKKIELKDYLLVFWLRPVYLSRFQFLEKKGSLLMIASIEALNPQELTLARAKAQAILETAGTDRSFLKKAAADPERTLSTFGFPVGARPFPAPDGFIDPICCSDGTCFSSDCPSTCYITFDM